MAEANFINECLSRIFKAVLYQSKSSDVVYLPQLAAIVPNTKLQLEAWMVESILVERLNIYLKQYPQNPAVLFLGECFTRTKEDLVAEEGRPEKVCSVFVILLKTDSNY